MRSQHHRHQQTMAQWESSVDAAIASGAAHVSVYDLQVRVCVFACAYRDVSHVYA